MICRNVDKEENKNKTRQSYQEFKEEKIPNIET